MALGSRAMPGHDLNERADELAREGLSEARATRHSVGVPDAQ